MVKGFLFLKIRFLLFPNFLAICLLLLYSFFVMPASLKAKALI